VRAQRPDVPPRIVAAVSRALAKNPRDRFDSMDEFAAELEACLDEVRYGTDSTRTVLNAPVPAPVRRRNVRARRRVTPGPLLVSLLALAALAVIVVAAVAVQRDNTGLPGISSAKGGGGGKTVALSAIGTYDPSSGDGEHDSEIGNATDRNAATYWTTEHYGNSDFGGLKDGVGLVLRVRGSESLEKLTVTSDTPGFTAVVKAGSSAASARADSSEETVGGKTTFDLKGLAGPVYVLWITGLDSSGRAHVNEVTATS
jgi:hypothetical protein